MEQAEPNLKVTDKRHFTAEGELKADVPESAPAETSVDASSNDPSPSPAASAQAAQAAAAYDAANTAPVSFSSFIISLATQAAEFLGDEPKDLGAARQVISALEMLKDKSEGRRTPEESRILDSILFDLRLAFVGSAKGVRP